MRERSDARAINDYWGRDDLERAILEALAAAGRNVDALTIDDLAPADQFHSGGKDATVRLARLVGARPGLRVLDVGGGLGGPARTLAAEFGCHVTVVDLTGVLRARRARPSPPGSGWPIASPIAWAMPWRSARPWPATGPSTSCGHRTAA